MNLVEKVDPGLLSIRQMCKACPCPPPHIEADADWYRIIFSRGEAEPYSLPGPESGLESRPEFGLESKTAQSVLKNLGNIAAPNAAVFPQVGD